MRHSLSSDSCKTLLLTNILPFWANRMVDLAEGGYYGRIDGFNKLHPQAPKGVILNARILWTFSAVANKFGQCAYKELAQRAFHYIRDHFMDNQFGGYYWMLDAKGNVLESKKQIYAQAFVVYALAEYYHLTEDEEALMMAKDCFRLIEQHSFDRKRDGYFEAFDRKWKPLKDLRLSDKDANEAKTMNTHLHVLEAYTNLYRVWKSDELLTQLPNLIKLFLVRFIREDGHFHLFFDENWLIKSNHYSYGHDIEGGWLLMEAAKVIGDELLIFQTSRAAVNLTNGALEGLDTDGGLMNEGEDGQVTDTDKHWWPQAEALIGLINAYELTDVRSYLEKAAGVWSFINKKLVDPKGEWHWMTDRNGNINYNEDKAGPWKCPYHNGRSMLELMHRLPLLSRSAETIIGRKGAF